MNGWSGLCGRFVRGGPDGGWARKGLQIYHDSRFELRLHFDQIQVVVAHESFGKFRREQAHTRKLLARQVEIEGVGFGNDLEYANFESITRFRPGHEDGA